MLLLSREVVKTFRALAFANGASADVRPFLANHLSIIRQGHHPAGLLVLAL
jgi:hypothetical protein